jgi:hypothetical protein
MADIPGPFLGNSSVKMLPLLGSRFLIMQQLDYNNRRSVFFMWSVVRGCKQDEVWSLVTCQLIVSSVWESMKRELELEAEE